MPRLQGPVADSHRPQGDLAHRHLHLLQEVGLFRLVIKRTEDKTFSKIEMFPHME